MRLHISHCLSFDLQTVPHPHVAVDLRQTCLDLDKETIKNKTRRYERNYVKWHTVLHLNLEWMDHDLHKHLLVWEEAVQIESLALYCLLKTSDSNNQLSKMEYHENQYQSEENTSVWEIECVVGRP